MRAISILHLSDLHISERDFVSQSIVLDALWDDIRNLRESGTVIDLAFFTGDLIAKGEYSEANVKLAKERFIAPLLQAAQISKEMLFLTPGNHDVNLKNRHQFASAALTQIKDQDGVARYLTEAKRYPVPDGLDGFNELVASLNLAVPIVSNAHYRTYRMSINAIPLGICTLNSAWRATGAVEDGDYGKLAIGRYQLDECVQSLGDADLVLGMFHHPTNWLAPFDSTVVNQQLRNHFDAIFYGHNHESDGMLVAGPIGSYFASNAGCLYQNRDYFNGYSIVRYEEDTGIWTVIAREYFESRQRFDTSIRFAPGGTQSYSIPQRDRGSLVTLPNAEYIKSLNDAVDARLLSSLISEVAPKSLRQLFVEPRLCPLSERQMHIDAKNRASNGFLLIAELVADATVTVFIGPKQSGKTTLLHRICQLASDIGLLPLPPFAGYVDLSHSIDTRARILDAIVRFTGGAYRRSEVVALLQAGLVVVCFDNLESASDRQLSAVTEFMNEFSKCRFYFAQLEELNSAISSQAIPDLKHEVRALYIHSFSRKETRALTGNWFGEDSTDRAAKVDEILESLSRLNIPRSPFLISALLWIKESNMTFSPVNQSSILDAFIDGVLDKLTESKARSGVDATIKRHFLAALAEHLYRQDKNGLSGNDLDRFTVDYFENRALTTSSGPFLQELVDRGILIEVSDHFVFKFDCIRAYFLAVRLRESSELLEEALRPENYLRFREELDYYSGLARDNGALLASSLTVLEVFHERLGLGLSLDYFNDVALNDSPIRVDVDNQAEFANRIIGERLEGEKREELLDRLDSRRPPTLVAAEVPEDRLLEPFPQFVAALQTTSAILRNSELVENVELKHRAYTTLTRQWAEVLIAVLISVDFLEDDAKAAELIASVLPLNNIALARYFLKVLAPNVILSLAVESLGTPKLQLIIERSMAESNQSVIQVLDSFLYVDLNLPGRFVRLEDLLIKHERNRFICELIFFKVAQIYLFKGLFGEDEKTVRNLLTRSLSAMFSNKTQVAKDRLKNRVIADFDRKRFLLESKGKL